MDLNVLNAIGIKKEYKIAVRDWASVPNLTKAYDVKIQRYRTGNSHAKLQNS